MKRPTSNQLLQHPAYGAVANITAINSAGVRQRVSESGNVVVDVKLANGEKRTLLLSSFVAPPVDAPEQKAAA